MWIEPKTDWQSLDFYNLSDYNRITGNIKYLYSKVIFYFKEFTIVNMDDLVVGSRLYSKHLNAIESNVDTLVKGTYNFSYTRRNYIGNGPSWRYADLNRIEGALLEIYNRLKVNEEASIKVPIVVGIKGGNPWL